VENALFDVVWHDPQVGLRGSVCGRGQNDRELELGSSGWRRRVSRFDNRGKGGESARVCFAPLGLEAWFGV
jgi:hypothetical protein